MSYSIRRDTRWDHLDDQYLYFTFNNIHYRNGTFVKLNKSYMDAHYPNKIQYAGFNYIKENGSTYMFYATNGNIKCDGEYGWISIEKCDINDAIEEIIRPFVVDVYVIKPKNDFEMPVLIKAWCIYVLILLASLVFVQFYFIWAIVSIIFFQYRKEMMNPKTYIQDIC